MSSQVCDLESYEINVSLNRFIVSAMQQRWCRIFCKVILHYSPFHSFFGEKHLHLFSSVKNHKIRDVTLAKILPQCGVLRILDTRIF